MRKDATLASLESTTPPAPTPRVLQKAAQAVPISIPFAADDFRATKPRWIGLTQPLEHPLLAHYHDTDFLKKHLRYIDWDGKYALRFRWRPLPLTYLAGKRMSSSSGSWSRLRFPVKIGGLSSERRQQQCARRAKT